MCLEGIRPRRIGASVIGAALALAWPMAAPAQIGDGLGDVRGTVDGEARAYLIHDGVLAGLRRPLATWQRQRATLRVTLEGVVPETGDDGREGMVILFLRFDLPADAAETEFGDAALVRADLLKITDWPQDAPEPATALLAGAENGALDVRINAFSGGAVPFIDLHVASTLCEADLGAEGEFQLLPGGVCREADLHFTSALMPWTTPERVEPVSPEAEPPPPVAEAAPPDAAAPDRGGGAALDVIGTISADFDGEPREWLTAEGVVRGEAGASAYFERITFEMPGFGDAVRQMRDLAGDAISAEELQQLDDLVEMLVEDNPMAGMMEQMGVPGMGAGYTLLSITGLDPESPNILRERALSIRLDLDDPDAVPLGQPMPADIEYYAEFSGGFIPELLYTSEDALEDARVTFDQLDLTPGGGHATGRFEATLCRLERARMMRDEGPDTGDCRRIEGAFDTALADESDRAE